MRNALFAAAVVATVAAPARAQTYDRPPADLPGQDQGYGAANPAAANVVRTDRLENQVRGLTGQVEQLQFQVRKLEDQLRKFQADVDQRLQDGALRGAPRPVAAAPQKRTDMADPAVTPEAQIAPSAAAAPAPTVGADGRRRDAFNPDAQPTAPGAPRPLGSTESASRPVARATAPRPDPTGPLDLTPPALRGAPAAAPAPAASGAVASLEPNAGAAAAPTADPVKVAYDAAVEQLKAQRYDSAQQEFSAFLEKNPHSRLIAPAIYHLGESYYYQNRHREAAEQFLKIATDFSKSSIAPDAMVKLGVSLNALGAKEQACAFFSELPRKYPNASAAEKTAAAREAKKASC